MASQLTVQLVDDYDVKELKYFDIPCEHFIEHIYDMLGACTSFVRHDASSLPLPVTSEGFLKIRLLGLIEREPLLECGYCHGNVPADVPPARHDRSRSTGRLLAGDMLWWRYPLNC